jgi:glyoxylase-like metal-dependent hydrolase (beta-lactamase superfamily II)
MARIVAVLPVGPLAVNCVIVADERTREAIVVDPGSEAERILSRLSELELRCVLVANTHAHLDHVGANAELVRRTGAPLRQHSADRPLYDALDSQADWMLGIMGHPEAVAVDGDLAHGTRLVAGDRSATVLHTPGHTPGSVCLLFESADEPPLLLAGDTLFAGGVGRTDLPGGDWEQLADSLRTRILPLEDGTRVIPGHGPETTIRRERQENPFLLSL